MTVNSQSEFKFLISSNIWCPMIERLMVSKHKAMISNMEFFEDEYLGNMIAIVQGLGEDIRLQRIGAGGSVWIQARTYEFSQ